MLETSSQSVTIFWDRPAAESKTRQPVRGMEFARQLQPASNVVAGPWPELKARGS